MLATGARYLEHLGYGMMAETLADAATVREFVERIPRCQEKLGAYAQDGNQDLFHKVDELLDRAAAGVL